MSAYMESYSKADRGNRQIPDTELNSQTSSYSKSIFTPITNVSNVADRMFGFILPLLQTQPGRRMLRE